MYASKIQNTLPKVTYLIFSSICVSVNLFENKQISHLFQFIFSYVKVYLLPDRSKAGKRKTKVKKHTLNPIFEEILKVQTFIETLFTFTGNLFNKTWDCRSGLYFILFDFISRKRGYFYLFFTNLIIISITTDCCDLYVRKQPISLIQINFDSYL